MGNNRNNRFKTAEECTTYLRSIDINTVTCLEYGGRFKAESIFHCDIDGYEWTTTLDALKYTKATGCPKCGKVARIKTVEEINQWLKDNNRNIECVYYDGTAASSKSKFKCLIDDYEWNGKVGNIKSGKGCPVCAKVKKITDIKEVNQWLREKDRNIKCIKYAGNVREKSDFKCDICNKTWTTSLNDIKNGSSCPHCSTSKGERYVAKILDKYNINYEHQYWFDDCRIQLPLPFDFALFKDNRLIGLCEYQGKQHYEPVDFASKGIEWAEKQFERNKYSDNIKRTYCKNNNIPLLEIPYWEYDNAENIILDFIKEVA